MFVFFTSTNVKSAKQNAFAFRHCCTYLLFASRPSAMIRQFQSRKIVFNFFLSSKNSILFLEFHLKRHSNSLYVFCINKEIESKINNSMQFNLIHHRNRTNAQDTFRAQSYKNFRRLFRRLAQSTQQD